MPLLPEPWFDKLTMSGRGALHKSWAAGNDACATLLVCDVRKSVASISAGLL